MSFVGYSIAGVAFSAGLILLDIYLLSKQKVSTGTFARWLVIGFAAGAVSLIPSILELLSIVLATQFLLSAATLVTFMILLLLIFYVDYRVGAIDSKIAKIVAKVAADEYTRRKSERLAVEDEPIADEKSKQ